MAPVVGPKGHVLVWEPTQFYKADSQKAFAEFKAKNPNVSIVATPFEAPSLPKNSADLVMLNLNYHDTYWQSDEVRHPADGPGRFPQDGLCGDEAGRGDRRHRPCREPQCRHPRDGREAPPDRSRSDQGRLQARRLRARRDQRHPAQSGRRPQPAGVRPEDPRQDRPRRSSSSGSRVERSRAGREKASPTFRAYWALGRAGRRPRARRVRAAGCCGGASRRRAAASRASSAHCGSMRSR